MDEKQVSHAGVDQSLERCQPNPLYDPRPQEALVIGTRCSSPGAANDDENSAQQIQMSFAPDPRACNEDQTSDSHPAQVISSQQCHLREVPLEDQGKRKCVGSQ